MYIFIIGQIEETACMEAEEIFRKFLDISEKGFYTVFNIKSDERD